MAVFDRVAIDLDLAQVRAFIAAADAAGFSRAASELHLSQQALSKRVANLEAVVGELFVREARGVRLTRRGEELLPHARALIASADAAMAAIGMQRRRPIRVDVWGHPHPPRALVQRFATAHPEAELEISMRRNFPQAIEALRAGELDVACGNVRHLDTPLPRELGCAFACSAPLRALVARSSPAAGADRLDAAGLRSLALWWPVAGTSPEVVGFVREYAASLGVPLQLEGSNVGLEAVVERVASDPTVFTLIAEDWPVGAGSGAVARPLAPAPEYPWYVVYRQAGERSAAVQELVTWVRAQAGAQPDDVSTERS